MRNQYGKTHLSLAIQQACIKAYFPQFSYSRSNKCWTGTFKPRENSPTYVVRVIYEPNNIPKVKVLKPELRSDAPHVYKNGLLCLYYPNDASWNRSKLLGKTIFPWIAEYLYFYELWLASGEWLGSEVQHGDLSGADAM